MSGNSNSIKNHQFAVLCYHYVRPVKDNDPFPKILGTTSADFRQQVRVLSSRYHVISPEWIHDLYYRNHWINRDEMGLAITFDDGLSDHYHAAEILAELGIKAFFFIPTCVVTDQLPPNPTIIHYCLSVVSIREFLRVYHEALDAYQQPLDDFAIAYEQGKSDPWTTMAVIKERFKYQIPHTAARLILLYLYEEILVKRLGVEIVEKMHLNRAQIKDMIAMGHTLGAHSHTHVSLGATDLSESDIELELTRSPAVFREYFVEQVNTYAYPYGNQKDCWPPEKLALICPDYQLAFTAVSGLNGAGQSPLALNRYLVSSRDSTESIIGVIDNFVCI